MSRKQKSPDSVQVRLNKRSLATLKIFGKLQNSGMEPSYAQLNNALIEDYRNTKLVIDENSKRQVL